MSRFYLFRVIIILVFNFACIVVPFHIVSYVLFLTFVVVNITCNKVSLKYIIVIKIVFCNVC